MGCFCRFESLATEEARMGNCADDLEVEVITYYLFTFGIEVVVMHKV